MRPFKNKVCKYYDNIVLELRSLIAEGCFYQIVKPLILQKHTKQTP